MHTNKFFLANTKFPLSAELTCRRPPIAGAFCLGGKKYLNESKKQQISR